MARALELAREGEAAGEVPVGAVVTRDGSIVAQAFNQLQTYQAQIPALFATNAALVVSDGVEARIGTLGAGKEWFKPWRTIEGSAARMQ